MQGVALASKHRRGSFSRPSRLQPGGVSVEELIFLGESELTTRWRRIDRYESSSREKMNCRSTNRTELSTQRQNQRTIGGR
jgi:hypothetical protein